MPNLKSKKSHKESRRAGFTVIEAVVMSAIVAFLAGTVLVKFGGLNDSIALNRSAQELALALRQAQSYALGVLVTGGAIPPQTGVKLSYATSDDARGYLIFSDFNGGTGNFFYDSPPDVALENGRFERNVRINSIRDIFGVEKPKVNVLFTSPEANVSLTDESGSSIGDLLTIELISPSGHIKRVFVRTSGQIGIIRQP